MRTIFTILGMVAIIAYAVLGAMLMNDWAVVAASGVPLETAIADMAAANQPYSAIPGAVFASLGIVLALAWGVATISRRATVPIWATASMWAGILALGAPAFFFTAFGNMNSVGDTYYNWNAEAAFALEAPLYMASGVAFLGATATMLAALAMPVLRKKPSPRPGHGTGETA